MAAFCGDSDVLLTAEENYNDCAWTVATTEPCSRATLDDAIHGMTGIVDRNPRPEFIDTLATLNLRAGRLEQSLTSYRDGWFRSRDDRIGFNLARAYGEARNLVHPPANFLQRNAGIQVEVQWDPIESRAGIWADFGPDDAADDDGEILVVHALVHEGERLAGLVELSSKLRVVRRSCELRVTVPFWRKATPLTAEIVWIGRTEHEESVQPCKFVNLHPRAVDTTE